MVAAAVLIPHRTGDANARAVRLLARDDAIGNLAVVVAAGLVRRTGGPWPDLALAAVVAGLLLRSSWSIVRDALDDLRTAARVRLGLVPGETFPCGKVVFVAVNHEGGHPMRKFNAPVAALAGVLATAGAFAQDPASPPGGPPAMTQQMPMQGGMCGPGGMCGMGAPAQGTPMQGMMQGMMQGQGGMMTGGCPMMRRSAAMEQRLRRLEERMGVPTPPTPPTQPGSPG